MVRFVTYVFIYGFSFMLCGGCESNENGYTYNPLVYTAKKTQDPIVIDGYLNDSAWQNIEWTSYFTDIEGLGEKGPPTRAKMTWNDSGLYIGAWLKEDHLWATLQEDESIIYRDNDFEFFIDPDRDTHDYVEFEINAMGTKWDLLMDKPYRYGGRNNDSFSLKDMQARVGLFGTLNNPADRDSCWTVELFVPWNAFPNVEKPPLGEFWKINFSRVQWELDIIDGIYIKRKDDIGKDLPEKNWTWTPQGVINMHIPERWGLITFREFNSGNVLNGDRIDSVQWVMREWFELVMKEKIKSGDYPDAPDFINPSNGTYKVLYNKIDDQFTIKLLINDDTFIIDSSGKFTLEK